MHATKICRVRISFFLISIKILSTQVQHFNSTLHHSSLLWRACFHWSRNFHAPKNNHPEKTKDIYHCLPSLNYQQWMPPFLFLEHWIPFWDKACSKGVIDWWRWVCLDTIDCSKKYGNGMTGLRIQNIGHYGWVLFKQ